MTDKQFEIGQKITFNISPYYHGGEDYNGQKGEVIRYTNFYQHKNCWELLVLRPGDSGEDYTMLECEFYEYEEELQPVRIEKKKIKLFE